MTAQEIIMEELNLIVTEIVKEHDAQGMRASGTFAREIEAIQRSGKSYEIDAVKYIEQLIRGRKPGTMPPVSAIEQWIRDKGITPQDGPITSLAFAIAKKIQREGTRYYRQGGTDLVDKVITDQRIQKIIDRVQDNHILNLKTNITRILTT